MDAFTQVTENTEVSIEPLVFDTDDMIELCQLESDTGECVYSVRLETDAAHVSLEGMNQFRISAIRRHQASDQKQKLWADLEINLREEMNSVSITNGSPYYFTITGKSLDLDNMEIDSSIHEVVDLGLLDLRVGSGLKSGLAGIGYAGQSGQSGQKENMENQQEKAGSILFDAFASNLTKASVSALLSHVTYCHKLVIHNAGRLFASRQDYVRDMCNSLTSNADSLSTSITSKAMNCDLLIL